MKAPVGWNDSRIEMIIGSLLRSGVLLAAGTVVIGAVIFLARHGEAKPDYHSFRGADSSFRSITGVLQATSHFRGQGIIQLGLLLLIATPVARVVFSAAAFALERDFLYVVITLAVLAILLYSMLGFAGG